jgi:hypothetical protein
MIGIAALGAGTVGQASVNAQGGVHGSDGLAGFGRIDGQRGSFLDFLGCVSEQHKRLSDEWFRYGEVRFFRLFLGKSSHRFAATQRASKIPGLSGGHGGLPYRTIFRCPE